MLPKIDFLRWTMVMLRKKPRLTFELPGKTYRFFLQQFATLSIFSRTSPTTNLKSSVLPKPLSSLDALTTWQDSPSTKLFSKMEMTCGKTSSRFRSLLLWTESGLRTSLILLCQSIKLLEQTLNKVSLK